VDSAVPGDKQDTGKPDMRLLPWRALREVARVMEWAVKSKPGYIEGGWKDAPDGVRRYTSAAMRHLGEVAEGVNRDYESNLPSLAHASACCLIALWHSLRSE
jgi:hypothetical protein